MSPPSALVPLGRLMDRHGRVLTLGRYARARPGPARPRRVIGVVGSGMNAGKTTAAAGLIRGLTAAGIATAGVKATGTGAFGDLHAYSDAGARFVADFTDGGLASTYRQPPARLAALLDALLGHAAEARCDTAVVELADGVLQAETAALLAHPAVVSHLDGIVFAAADGLSALGGLSALERRGIAALAVTGLLTRAPLAVREVEAATGAWVLDADTLADPAVAGALLAAARPAGRAPAPAAVAAA